MPLPTSIPSGEDKTPADKPDSAEPSLPGLPVLPPRERQAAPRSPQQGGLPTPPRPAQRPAEGPPPAPAPKVALPPGWAIDAKTGVKYRTLAPTDPAAMKAFEAGGKKGLTLDQLRNYVPEADFDVDDLNGAASEFLAHLRVPVPKEEIEAARRARRAKQASQAAASEADQGDSSEVNS